MILVGVVSSGGGVMPFDGILTLLMQGLGIAPPIPFDCQNLTPFSGVTKLQ